MDERFAVRLRGKIVGYGDAEIAQCLAQALDRRVEAADALFRGRDAEDEFHGWPSASR
jgi:hypothetical protein